MSRHILLYFFYISKRSSTPGRPSTPSMVSSGLDNGCKAEAKRILEEVERVRLRGEPPHETGADQAAVGEPRGRKQRCKSMVLKRHEQR